MKLTIMALFVLFFLGCSDTDNGQPALMDQQQSLDLVRIDLSVDQGSDAAREKAGFDSGAPLKWITIQPGEFIMGSPVEEPCRANVPKITMETQHEVQLTHAFLMGRTEVTQGEFSVLMGYNPAKFTACGETCPVEQVNWHEAVAYCNALTLAELGEAATCYTCQGEKEDVLCEVLVTYTEGENNIYNCPGYRLPTEAEWEYAYRAGSITAFYDGSIEAERCDICDELELHAAAIGWYCSNSEESTHPVGQKQPNAWGINDLAGNVWEICHDYYHGDLGTAKVMDPVHATPPSPQETSPVMRGGCYDSTARILRAAYRAQGPRTVRGSQVGFRCVRSE